MRLLTGYYMRPDTFIKTYLGAGDGGMDGIGDFYTFRIIISGVFGTGRGR